MTSPLTNPDKVRELTDLFWQEAERYKVLPLLAALAAFFGQVPPLPDIKTVRVPGRRPERDAGDDPAGVQPFVRRSRADLVVPATGASEA